jgi:hypothetical protein
MPEQPEPETKPAAASKPDKSTTPAKPAVSAASDNPVNPEITQTPTPDTAPPADSITNPDAFISPTAGWKTFNDGASSSNISISKEIIDGVEKDVLTINATLAGGDSKWTGATLTEENFLIKVLAQKSKWTGTTTANLNLIQKLTNANGVRFKAVGDGKKWEFYFPTTDVTDTAYHGFIITTQNGKVGNFDVPFNKLIQPSFGSTVRFRKTNLKGIVIQKSSTIGSGSGATTIKIYDFEVY